MIHFLIVKVIVGENLRYPLALIGNSRCNYVVYINMAEQNWDSVRLRQLVFCTLQMHMSLHLFQVSENVRGKWKT